MALSFGALACRLTFGLCSCSPPTVLLKSLPFPFKMAKTFVHALSLTRELEDLGSPVRFI